MTASVIIKRAGRITFLFLLLQTLLTGQNNIFPSSGNVGIGTRNPAFLLSLGPSTGNTKLALYETGVANSYGLGVIPGAFRLHLSGNGARFAFFNSDEPSAQEVFTIMGRGNVGIGTANPGAKLDVAGNIRTQIIEITGGSDLAEPFSILGEEIVEPGMVVSIDPTCPGQLRIAREAYDRKVAGIVSGARGVEPGLVMYQESNIGQNALPVALTGRVYCLVDATYSPVESGDLLTTSDTPGYAMKAADGQRGHGAILGKAMTPLSEGKGWVLVLVSLQ